MLQQVQKQRSEQVWQEEVVSRLPAETEAQARTLRVFVYQRAFACACDLLRGLLSYVLFAGSLRELSWIASAGRHCRYQRSRLEQANGPSWRLALVAGAFALATAGF